jgi:hypothetical protein
VYNLLPGQGLGDSASRLLAYGLGPAIAPLVEIEEKPEYRGGGQLGGVWDLQDLLREKGREYYKKEDEEMLEILIQVLTSGVLN